MKKEERRAIKEIFEVCIETKNGDKLLAILKKANSQELNDLLYEAYLKVVRMDANAKKRELERENKR